jgi:flagellin
MGELRTMAQDITKNSQDIENYSKEFVELQSQLNQIKQEKFNGISLFSAQSSTVEGTLNQDTTETVKTAGGVDVNYEKYGRTLITHPSGIDTMGSISINVVNLQFVLSIGTLANSGATDIDLGGLDTGTAGSNGINASGFIADILDVNVSQFTEAIERLADMRAENGAEQNRVMNTLDLLQTNITNLEAAHGRIMDADIALESTRFARHNVLVQASAAMTAQANQLTNVALQLLG